MTTTAAHILDAIRRHYPTAAIVPELTIEDHQREPGETHTTATRRIDALMFQSLIRTAIEIKVTRADMARDTYWKRRPWQRVTHRFVYAVPADLDVMAPHGCGLWHVHDDGTMTVVKKAILSKTPEPLPQTVIQRLAYRASGTPWEPDDIEP